jgi:hypothetical protein
VRLLAARTAIGGEAASISTIVEEPAVPSSVLDAIKLGLWDFEPEQVAQTEYNSTSALPGSDAKLAVMAERLRSGLPLWHPSDVRNYEDLDACDDEVKARG